MINNITWLDVWLPKEINLDKKCNNIGEKCSIEKPEDMRELLFTIVFQALTANWKWDRVRQFILSHFDTASIFMPVPAGKWSWIHAEWV